MVELPTSTELRTRLTAAQERCAQLALDLAGLLENQPLTVLELQRAAAIGLEAGEIRANMTALGRAIHGFSLRATPDQVPLQNLEDDIAEFTEQVEQLLSGNLKQAQVES